MTDADVFATPLAQTIFLDKYSLNRKERWGDTAHRVVDSVVGDQYLGGNTRAHAATLKNEVRQLIVDRKFIPGGRYLASAGKEFHQINNCFDGDTEFVTDRGIRHLRDCVGETVTILNRHGEWETGEVRSFGQQVLQRITFSNRTSVRATAGHAWYSCDGERTTIDKLDRVPFNRMRTMPETDEEGIRHGIVFGDGSTMERNLHSWVQLIGHKQELARYFKDEEVAVPMFGGDTVTQTYSTVRVSDTYTKVALQPKHYKTLPSLQVTPTYARGFIAGLIATDGSTKTSSVTISMEGREVAEHVAKLAVLAGCVVNGMHQASTVSPFDGSPRDLWVIGMKPFSVPLIRSDQVAEKGSGRAIQKMWVDVDGVETEAMEEVFCVTNTKSQSFTLANGLITGNCFLGRAEDSREGWADVMYKTGMWLMTGGGIGWDYSAVRPRGSAVVRTGGVATGPIELMKAVNEFGRAIVQGGNRRSAIYASLHWQHGDIAEFLELKNWSPELRAAKLRDLNFPLPMEFTNISLNYDKAFFDIIADAQHPLHAQALGVWTKNCRQAFKTAEPGFSFNYKNARETLRNACCEVTSEDDSDKCNLGTMWMSKFDNIDDFAYACDRAVFLLLCGGIYTDHPTDRVAEVGRRNNRIGLGLGGMHEWLMRRGSDYEVTPELHRWLAVYRDVSDEAALKYSRMLGVNEPKGKRAIAPNGTIGMIAETTTGIEPLFCAAYKRRYLNKADKWLYQYVIDGAAKRLMSEGVSAELLDRNDAYSLTFEQRVKFQADVQDYVDMAISSTCNMSAWGSESNNADNVQEKADILLRYGPRLRGFTCYPDGARGGQPLTKVDLATAQTEEGVVYREDVVECAGGVCGV